MSSAPDQVGSRFVGGALQRPACATAEEALAFVRAHGVVLASAKGPAPRLTEAIIGEPIRGSWWAHPKSHHIYAILAAVTDSDQVLVCRQANTIDEQQALAAFGAWVPLAKR